MYNVDLWKGFPVDILDVDQGDLDYCPHFSQETPINFVVLFSLTETDHPFMRSFSICTPGRQGLGFPPQGPTGWPLLLTPMCDILSITFGTRGHNPTQTQPKPRPTLRDLWLARRTSLLWYACAVISVPYFIFLTCDTFPR